MTDEKMAKQQVVEIDGKQTAGKRAYHRPVLRVYGQVKQLTQAAGTLPVTDGVLPRMMSSDRRLKADLARIGDHPLGIGLYLFDFKAEYRDLLGHGRQFGVMADEVEAVMPQAVSVHPDGYKMVNYAMLGIVRTPN